MTDILPAIAEWLKDIAQTELAMPDAFAKYPVITLSEVSNTASVIISEAERLCGITVQVDVWDRQPDPRTVTEMSEAVSVRLTARGLSRVFGQLIREEEGIQRKCMRFSCAVDEVSNRIYKN